MVKSSLTIPIKGKLITSLLRVLIKGEMVRSSLRIFTKRKQVFIKSTYNRGKQIKSLLRVHITDGNKLSLY